MVDERGRIVVVALIVGRGPDEQHRAVGAADAVVLVVVLALDVQVGVVGLDLDILLQVFVLRAGGGNFDRHAVQVQSGVAGGEGLGRSGRIVGIGGHPGFAAVLGVHVADGVRAHFAVVHETDHNGTVGAAAYFPRHALGAVVALGSGQVDEGALDAMEVIINSMTKAEREKPDLLNGSRRARIAAGAGVTVSDVNQLIKKFNETKKMMKKFLQIMKI